MLGRVLRLAGAVVVLACAGCSERDEPPDSVTVDEPSIAPGASEAEVPDGLREQLEALGYVSTNPTDRPELRGVTARQASSRGLNVHCTRDRAYAVLTDMAGHELHRWTASEDEARTRTWMHVEPRPDGSLFVLTKDRDITKYDFDSQLVWRHRMRAHHDLAFHEDGRIFVLARRRHHWRYRGERIPVLADSVAVLSPEGELLETHELLPLFGDAIPAHRLARNRDALGDEEALARLVRAGGVGDVLHTNSIELLHREIPGVAPAGSILVSFRALSRIAILDADASRVLFTWGEGELQQQHDARQLPNGNLMVFDNGIARRRSRAIELDPVTREIVWQYTDDDLFSRIRGGAQPLPNGNVLITESEEGHALEVTRGGELVWEYWNPDVRAGHPPRRAVIYRLNRVPESYFDPSLELAPGS